MEPMETLYYHLVLPARVPGSRPRETKMIDRTLSQRMRKACHFISEQLPSGPWQSLLDSFTACYQLNCGSLDTSTLVDEFRNIGDKTLILHVVEQNAGLLVYYRRSTELSTDAAIVFEVFEASPSPEAVLSARSALLCDFPGRSVQIPTKEFNDVSFQKNLAMFLEKASLEALSRFAARATKAKTSVIEIRNSPDCALVSQFLTTVLEAIGSPANISRFRKRVRDDVNLDEAELPWRRAPMWLVLRVGARRHLCTELGNEVGLVYYKFLICVVLAQFLSLSASSLHPEMVMTVKAKLCRRLAKLEMDKPQATETAQEACRMLFTALGGWFNSVVHNATSTVEGVWSQYKSSILRRVPELPHKLEANDPCFRLSLRNSRKHLRQILHLRPQNQTFTFSLQLPPMEDGTLKQLTDLANSQFKLFELEQDIEIQEKEPPSSEDTSRERCLELSDMIISLIDQVGEAYHDDPAQTSLLVLSLLDLWVAMDRCAIVVCPLLYEYIPFFTAESLDVLHLPRLEDMMRLQTIQVYLQERRLEAGYQVTHMFSLSPLDGGSTSLAEKNSFPSRFLSQDSQDAAEIFDTWSDIAMASKGSHDRKSKEWRYMSQQYKAEYEAMLESGPCICIRLENGEMDVTGCTKCYHSRKMHRMVINIHEEFLPEDKRAAASVVFELVIPDYLAAYRNATWKIFSALGNPRNPVANREAPGEQLLAYSQLQRWITPSAKGSVISLASIAKSFLITHYKGYRLKGSPQLSDVLMPLALDLKYYDTSSGSWVDSFRFPPSFAHSCGIAVPGDLSAALKLKGATSSSSYRLIGEGPSSYEATASLTRCPPNMSTHEFLAYQRLLSGNSRRWLSMLMELGASNLNFSSEEAARLMAELAVQAGPIKKSGHVLRDAHLVFEDMTFCACLSDQLEKRLHSLNWRESHCMDMIITLSLRLFELSSTGTSSQRAAEKLLKTAREMTLTWVRTLREEVCFASEADRDAVETAAEYGRWAALLCRKTFAIYLRHKRGSRERLRQMTATDTETFIEASVGLQEQLIIDIGKLSRTFKSQLVRDLKMAFKLRFILKTSIEVHSAALSAAINAIWSKLDDTQVAKSYSRPVFLTPPNDRWVVVQVGIETQIGSQRRAIHYNFVEGHLLIDGKPLGKLPLAIRECEQVKELFGNRHLLTYPSSMAGMGYMLSGKIGGHEIHFGFRNQNVFREQKVVIRALTNNGILELIPRDIFGVSSGGPFDLPAQLVDECVHWLNLHKRRLEIRRKISAWKPEHSTNWILSLSTYEANNGNNQRLIDPQSAVFGKIEESFRAFEVPQQLIVQSKHKANSRGMITVHLKRHNLRFHVNANGRLECPQLQAEIDPNQDAGTLYGLQSKIVLRDLKNKSQRSIITPCGRVRANRHGPHLLVEVEPGSECARFGIDDVLGRLSCPPESQFLYFKAFCHGLTSFALPDPLTGRTGREEAQETLKSAICQPWQPIPKDIADRLRFVMQPWLCPTREWYPPNRRTLQKTGWGSGLEHVQHDGYDSIILRILEKSDRLQPFFDTSSTDTEAFSDVSHLRQRAEMRQRLYERNIGAQQDMAAHDVPYKSRDHARNLGRCVEVFQITKLARQTPFSLHMSEQLYAILERHEVLGGFCDTPEASSYSLADLVERPVSDQWGTLVKFCRTIDKSDNYTLAFHLALLAFNEASSMDIIKSLAAFSRLDGLRALQTPDGASFTDFECHTIPAREFLQNLIAAEHPTFLPGPGRQNRQQDAAREVHKHRLDKEGEELADHLISQWPNRDLSVEGFTSSLLNMEDTLNRIRPHWHRLYDNFQLSKYVTAAQVHLNRNQGPKETAQIAPDVSVSVFKPFVRNSVAPSLSRDLLSKRSSQLAQPQINRLALRPKITASEKDSQSPLPPAAPRSHYSELEKILGQISSDADRTRLEYAGDLRRSLEALKCMSSQMLVDKSPPTIDSLSTDLIHRLWENVSEQLLLIRQALSAEEDRHKWLDLGGLWPCTSTVTILEQLRSIAGHEFGEGMKESIVRLGVLLAELQRLHRMRNGLLRRDPRRVHEEHHNPGHTNWNPVEYPDFLLLELDSNIMIREEQFQVAQAIIEPESGSNSVLQMNMGKGKTSCIVPMATAVLANQGQLCRLVVPKALLLQTAQLMQSRMGGLLGREIRHIPFSRRTKTRGDMIQLYTELHQETLNRGGVLLALPEHILSFKLSGLQRLVESKSNEARKMVEFQDWLSSSARDVLDESDFTLAVKTQLIYPSGSQKSVDGHPHRWLVAQALLSSVESHIQDLQNRFPKSLEVVKEASGFPKLHLLHTNVEEALKTHLIDDICDGVSSVFRLSDTVTPATREKLRQALSDGHGQVSASQIAKAKRAFMDRTTGGEKILLVRGLLHTGILLLCLKKRWNVQYGLHPDRCPIAVPYEAKGVPSEQAEFGHPDVAIIFTCLAFYYSGLSLAQFISIVAHTFKSDDPGTEYDRWTQACPGLPDELRQWNLVNPEDHVQLERLWPCLRLNKATINQYMNVFVFPTYARQFEVKLQASGWDIPLFPSASEDGHRQLARTTGFSGTNDNKYLLPLNIKQDDLPSLSQTNAEVLGYLLQHRNRRYEVLVDSGKKRLTEDKLLHKLKDSKIRVLIDAGAFILEMKNEDLVKEWLKIDYHADAAVYIGEDNRAWVRYHGAKKPVHLLATPYAENMENCLVYLDEAHTRGTDLKLPQEAKGALTLALGQTKDHTVQAAMRLRQLGTTQSVVFFAPPEVDRSIHDVCQLKPNTLINSSHCVRWLLEMTCRANEQLRALYLAQGVDFCRRMNAAWENPKFLAGSVQRDKFLKVIQQKESQTLRELYGGGNQGNVITPVQVQHPQLKEFMDNLTKKTRGGNNGGDLTHSSAFEEVEQEREVEFQVEEVREVQKPVHYKPLTYSGLHQNIINFCFTGALKGDEGYEQVFAALGKTALGKQFKVQATSSRLFVSSEFTKTIQLIDKTKPLDDFFRSTDWLLWAPKTETALIIVPEEAENLITMLRNAPMPRVHLIPYAAPVTRNMVQFGSLAYFALPRLPFGSAIPEWLTIETGVLAGRLYFDFAEYAALRDYIQAQCGEPLEEIPQLDGASATKQVGAKETEVVASNFLGFLLEWLTLRRRNQDITHTPMGYVCQRRVLTQDNVFFRRRDLFQDAAKAPRFNRRSSEDADAESRDDGSGSDIDGWDEDDRGREDLPLDEDE
ncbi:hypothetical protein B0H67DRAFT_665770 [Lasiosphaeris hirsuta]|uniref:ubiquitinyl hydrolase 1 n=1 Tax=Lasiosphaeris hirsuta TaxID=260670 RepID=A0AA40DXS4_9PEZI|nr:hypothetical protein B0H67DRAFT_665770 [Lasiosphaeris hirsuta]